MLNCYPGAFAEYSMISRDRVIRTLNHQSIDRAPRDLWLLPGMEASRPDDVAEINLRFPSDVLHLETKWPAGKRSKGDSQKAGPYTDAWGCTWQLGRSWRGGGADRIAVGERVGRRNL